MCGADEVQTLHYKGLAPWCVRNRGITVPESHQEVMRSYTFSKGKARQAHINMNLCNEEPRMAGRSAGVGICTEAYKLGAAQKQ